MIKIIAKSSYLLGLLIFINGCASLTTGQNQSVSVETPGNNGSTCTLTNDKGAWHIPSTPGSVTVLRSYGDMHVTCRNGTKRGNINLISQTKGMAFGNILAGGVIGAAVDCGTGSAYDYPSNNVVMLSD